MQDQKMEGTNVPKIQGQKLKDWNMQDQDNKSWYNL